MSRDDLHKRTPSGKPRARAFSIPFDGVPGENNAITDVPGVSVGYTTLISGEGTLAVGSGPVRTGVTAILPRSLPDLATPVFAGMFSGNGDGELTGSHLIDELGAFNFPVTITNTHSCGVTRDGTLRWMQKRLPQSLDSAWALPVAGETYDGFLNDINGHHVELRPCLCRARCSQGRADRGRQRRRRRRHDRLWLQGGLGHRLAGRRLERPTVYRRCLRAGKFRRRGATSPFVAYARRRISRSPRSREKRRAPKKARSSRSSPLTRHSWRIR